MTQTAPKAAEAPVLLTIEEGIAHVRLNRPEAANGMSVELLKALYDAIMACHGTPGVRALLLTGAGKNFCAGGDVQAFAAKGTALPDYIRPATAYLQDSVLSLARLQAPVIVAVQGFAAGGGGFGLVCAADLVIAAESAKFLAGATRVAMAPDAGVSATLPRLVGLRKATEILLTNPIIDAAEALRLGLVTKVVPDAELAAAAQALAKELAEGAPLALAATKRLLRSGMAQGMEACLSEEARTVSELSGTADAREGLAAVIARRKPVFTGA
ncbi:MAG: enoyl-CoA hydratase/isomerase family protein [Rhodospirillaceae bacterium]|nr:enoyl-CoA hydratase/isomerase family protein [Rhodospirillaceae bacterium]